MPEKEAFKFRNWRLTFMKWSPGRNIKHLLVSKISAVVTQQFLSDGVRFLMALFFDNIESFTIYLF